MRGEFTEEIYMPVLRVVKNVKNTLIMFSLLALVTACGGSGPATLNTDGGTTGDSGDSGDLSTSPTITLAWEAEYSQEGNTILDTEPRTLTITLADADGQAIADELVDEAASLGSLFPSSGTVATNSNGVATVQIDVTNAEEGEAGAVTVV